MIEQKLSHIIRDEAGNLMSQAEYEACLLEGRLIMDAFFDSLKWRPIEQYDKEGGEWMMLGNGTEWALGFWGENPPLSTALETDPVTPSWRHAQDFRYGVLVGFEPTEFAAVDDEWREKLQGH